MRKSKPKVSLEEELGNVANHYIEDGNKCDTLANKIDFLQTKLKKFEEKEDHGKFHKKNVFFY